MATQPTLNIRIDRIRCDGYGMCAELLPELIELDDWGYPIVRSGAVPADLLDHARRAVDVCPVLAFRLTAAPASPAQARGIASRATNGSRFRGSAAPARG